MRRIEIDELHERVVSLHSVSRAALLETYLERVRGELRDARVLLENRDDHIRRVREENETLRRELREKGE